MAKRHYKQMHWTYRNGEQKAKKGFATLDEALLFMKRNKFEGEVCPYVCDVCGMWHIGHHKD